MYSDNLQKIILELKASQTEIAANLNMSRQQLNNIANGRSNLTDKFLEALHRKYNVNVNYILTGEGSMFLSNQIERGSDIIHVKAPKGSKVLIEYVD